MDEGKSTKKTEAGEAPVKGRSGKKSDRKESTPKVKATAPKREKVENPVVFAFRLSEAERTRIHEAAGGGKASQFVLAAALAAASGDKNAFEAVIASRATK
mgnify:CR=1 FL=1